MDFRAVSLAFMVLIALAVSIVVWVTNLFMYTYIEVEGMNQLYQI